MVEGCEVISSIQSLRHSSGTSSIASPSSRPQSSYELGCTPRGNLETCVSAFNGRLMPVTIMPQVSVYR